MTNKMTFTENSYKSKTVLEKSGDYELIALNIAGKIIFKLYHKDVCFYKKSDKEKVLRNWNAIK